MAARTSRAEATNDRQQGCSQHRAEQVFQVVGEARQGQGAGVITFIRKNIRDHRLEQRREACGRGLQQRDQHIDVPDLGDEWQHQGDACPDQVKRDEHRLS